MKLQQIVTDVLLNIQAALRDELAAQGHVLTGKLSDSIKFEVSEDGREAVGQMFVEDYGVFVDMGVTADRIPFGKRAGGGKSGGKSAYIQGLIDFWEHRGLSGREAIGAAFATAHDHARDCMPSRGSYAYTTTGERTGFVRAAVENKTDEIRQILEQRIGTELSIDFKTGLDESNAKIRFSA